MLMHATGRGRAGAGALEVLNICRFSCQLHI